MKHPASRFLLGFLPLLILTQAALAGANEKRLSQFEKYALAPVKDFRYFQLIGFETLSDDTVAVWTGVNKVFLIKVSPPCPQLDFAKSLSLGNSMGNTFSARFDAVRFGHTRCFVDSIRPVNYKAMKQARNLGD